MAITNARTINVAAGDISGLQAAVAASNVRVVIAAGTYSGALTSCSNDADIIAARGAVLDGHIDVNSRNRIHWTGGAINNNSSFLTAVLLFNCNDIMFDNVNLESTPSGSGDEVVALRPGASRIAFINTTIRLNQPSGSGWGIHPQRSSARTYTADSRQR